ncbi:MAG: hypothetical protein LBL38_01360 [Lactobacillales bacterium]|jgi:hypothetical protein|nr:hypothetical protein [Lactobacillales bacterium]
MIKIIKIKDDKVFIGKNDYSLEEIDLSKFNFIPQLGDNVELFGEGDNIVVNKVDLTQSKFITDIEQADNGGFLWGLLGCFVPVAGLVLFLVWRSIKPKTAKAVGIGALISLGIRVFCYMIIIAMGVGIGLHIY